MAEDSAPVAGSELNDTEHPTDGVSRDASIVDPNCVAENPYRVTFQDITSAAFLIKAGIECTPCTVSVVVYADISMECFFIYLMRSHFRRNLECHTKAWTST